MAGYFKFMLKKVIKHFAKQDGLLFDLCYAYN